AQPIEENVAQIAAHPIVRDAERVEDELRRDLIPERVQFLETRLRWVARDQCRVDRADGDARDPIRLQIGLRQPLIYAGLEGAEPAAPLQHKSEALERRPLQPAVSLEQRLDELRSGVSARAPRAARRGGGRALALPRPPR